MTGRHHDLPATPEVMVLGHLDAATPAVLEVESGDTVTLRSFPAGGRACLPPDPARVPADYLAALDALPAGPGPHFLTGPIHLRGASPGDTLQVDILDATPTMDWGFVSIAPLLGTLPDELGAAPPPPASYRGRSRRRDVQRARRHGPALPGIGGTLGRARGRAPRPPTRPHADPEALARNPPAERAMPSPATHRPAVPGVVLVDH